MSRRRLAYALILVGVLILADQVIGWGHIDWEQVLHHEFFSGVAMAFGAGILIGSGSR